MTPQRLFRSCRSLYPQPFMRAEWDILPWVGRKRAVSRWSARAHARAHASTGSRRVADILEPKKKSGARAIHATSQQSQVEGPEKGSITNLAATLSRIIQVTTGSLGGGLSFVDVWPTVLTSVRPLFHACCPLPFPNALGDVHRKVSYTGAGGVLWQSASQLQHVFSCCILSKPEVCLLSHKVRWAVKVRNSPGWISHTLGYWLPTLMTEMFA